LSWYTFRQLETGKQIPFKPFPALHKVILFNTLKILISKDFYKPYSNSPGCVTGTFSVAVRLKTSIVACFARGGSLAFNLT
jgi:hypothetical protein